MQLDSATPHVPLTTPTQSVDGSLAEHILELISISVNKNTVPGDTGSALHPSGLRIGGREMISLIYNYKCCGNFVAYLIRTKRVM